MYSIKFSILYKLGRTYYSRNKYLPQWVTKIKVSYTSDGIDWYLFEMVKSLMLITIKTLKSK
jgi:hypothetical protein